MLEIKRVSNYALEKAALAEDSQMVELSLSAFALYKLASKQQLLENSQWQAFTALLASELEHADNVFPERVVDGVSDIDDSMASYARDVVQAERVSHAERMRGLGLSAGKAAALAGIERDMLVPCAVRGGQDVAERYGFTKRLLGGGP